MKNRDEAMEIKFQELKLDDQKAFAKGCTGECYRLDEETILKLYYEDYPLEFVIREKEGAKAALVAGVPTAISFNMARVGARYGVVYELLKGRTISEVIAEDPSRVEEMGRKISMVARTLHRAEVKETAKLPLATLMYRDDLPKVDWISGEGKKQISAFLDRLDLDRQYVHGDYNMNNVIFAGEEPMLIDMGDFAIGSPLLDVATIFFSLFESPEARAGGRNTFNGLTPAQAADFWRAFSQDYFGGDMTPEDTGLLRGCVLLKKMDFACRFSRLFSAAYGEEIRREMAEAFEKGSDEVK